MDVPHIALTETALILNMRERAAVNAAHVFEFWHAGGQWHALCACGVEFSSQHAGAVSDAKRAHRREVMDFVAGRKVAEWRTGLTADELSEAVEAALRDGIRPAPSA